MKESEAFILEKEYQPAVFPGSDALKPIERLLISLGATPNYTGFHYTALAIALAVSQENRLLCLAKQLYPDIARTCCTTSASVERNIRTLIGVIWERNPELLRQISGCPLPKKPSNAQFVGIMSKYFSFKAPCTLPAVQP